MIQCFAKSVQSYGNLRHITRCLKAHALRGNNERRPIMVIALDKNKKPLGWCKPERASGLIKAGRAVVYRYFPFTIILKDKDVRKVKVKHDYRIKIDPGATETGITVVEFAPDGTGTVILFTQIEHRGLQVVKNLQMRNGARRNRRQRETWYRHCKFPKGCAPTARPKGWLPPSQLSIANNVITFVNKLIRFLGPCAVTVESVKFDTQLMENSDIERKQYQQGTLAGYEIKSYLMERYHHTCQYCGGVSGDRRLEWEHKVPKSRGGSDSVKNATLACNTCNATKDNKTPEEWFDLLKQKKHLSELEEAQINGVRNVIEGKSTNIGLRYAAWSNTTRWYLVNEIKKLQGVTDFELTSGGRTAYNRHVLGYEKDHHIDALVAGKHNPPIKYRYDNQPVLYIKAMGRGSRFRGVTNNCGIITTKWYHHNKMVNIIQTGDLVKADTPNGKYKGTYTGRVMVRNSNCHNIRCFSGTKVVTTNKTSFTVIQRKDGYTYSFNKKKGKVIPPTVKTVGFLS